MGAAPIAVGPSKLSVRCLMLALPVSSFRWLVRCSTDVTTSSCSSTTTGEAASTAAASSPPPQPHSRPKRDVDACIVVVVVTVVPTPPLPLPLLLLLVVVVVVVVVTVSSSSSAAAAATTTRSSVAAAIAIIDVAGWLMTEAGKARQGKAETLPSPPPARPAGCCNRCVVWAGEKVSSERECQRGRVPRITAKSHHRPATLGTRCRARMHAPSKAFSDQTRITRSIDQHRGPMTLGA